METIRPIVVCDSGGMLPARSLRSGRATTERPEHQPKSILSMDVEIALNNQADCPVIAP